MTNMTYVEANLMIMIVNNNDCYYKTWQRPEYNTVKANFIMEHDSESTEYDGKQKGIWQLVKDNDMINMMLHETVNMTAVEWDCNETDSSWWQEFNMIVHQHKFYERTWNTNLVYILVNEYEFFNLKNDFKLICRYICVCVCNMYELLIKQMLAARDGARMCITDTIIQYIYT